MNRVLPTVAERVLAELPQTQCTRCGFPACRPYAEAIATGEADIDRCPPGGNQGVVALANLLQRVSKPLDPAYGNEAPPTIAVIDEAVCIACTKCIQACPVDAIVGAAKRMHTIIAAECTGCELCIAPCPVDCIAIVPISASVLARAAVLQRAAHARTRYEARNRRLQSERDAREQRRACGAVADAATNIAPITRNAVLEAIARGRARRARPDPDPSSA